MIALACDHGAFDLKHAIMKHLAPKGVMVVVEAEHMCMTMRGVKKPGSRTVTVSAKGCFKNDTALQDRVLSMIGR